MNRFESDYNKLFNQDNSMIKKFDVATAMNLDIKFEDDTDDQSDAKSNEKEEEPKAKHNRKVARLWTLEELDRLSKAVDKHGTSDWSKISNIVGTRDNVQCREKWRKLKISSETAKLYRKRSFSEKEDKVIIEWVKLNGVDSWDSLSKLLDIKSSWLSYRWHEHLDPNIVKSEWTLNEELCVLKLFKIHKRNWKNYQTELKNRSPRDIKESFFYVLTRELKCIDQKYPNVFESIYDINNLSSKNSCQLEKSTISKLIPYAIKSLRWKINNKEFIYDELTNSSKIKAGNYYQNENITKNKLKEIKFSNNSNVYDWDFAIKGDIKMDVIESFKNIPLSLHNKILKTVVSQLHQIKSIKISDENTLTMSMNLNDVSLIKDLLNNK